MGRAVVLVLLAGFGVGGAAAGPARLVVTPAAPTAGTAATITVRAKVAGPVVVRLATPLYTSVGLRLRAVNRTLWRASYRFAIPGRWMLAFKGVRVRVAVAPYPESTFVPPGVPGCLPPSPANPITREARGSGSLWALLDGGRLVDAHAAVLSGVLGKETKIIWRMTGSGDLKLSAVALDGAPVAPNETAAHEGGSTWERPGDEWGSGFTFLQTGCWRIHAQRADSEADLWLLVRS